MPTDVANLPHKSATLEHALLVIGAKLNSTVADDGDAFFCAPVRADAMNPQPHGTSAQLN